jgi:hypothetical protein
VAVPALLRALEEGPADVRKVAVVALGEIGPAASAAVEPLTRALEDGWLATCAREALAKVRPAAGPDRKTLARLAAAVCAAWVLASLAGLAATALSWSGQALSAPAGAAATSAFVLGGVGSVLGGVLGLSRRSAQAVVLGPVLFGLGGAFAGLMLGLVYAGLVGPVVDALAGPPRG